MERDDGMYGRMVQVVRKLAPKKYPRILGNLSKDKRASILGYFAK